MKDEAFEKKLLAEYKSAIAKAAEEDLEGIEDELDPFQELAVTKADCIAFLLDCGHEMPYLQELYQQLFAEKDAQERKEVMTSYIPA